MSGSNKPPNASDSSLLHQLRSGAKDAATQLFARYAARLRALAAKQSSTELARRVDPDDIVQSVFRTFFRRAATGEFEVPAGEDLWKLFLVIALNKVRAAAIHHQADKRDVRRTEGVDSLAGQSPDSDASELRTLQLTIDELMSPLPPSVREVVTLRVAGEEVNEIARKTGRAKRSVERILHEFRASLAAVLSQD
jgi:RNA polymerase sigma-70 factor (ECF subfamily)